MASEIYIKSKLEGFTSFSSGEVNYLDEFENFSNIKNNLHKYQYSNELYDIIIKITYNAEKQYYCAIFTKKGELYIPKETNFDANTLSTLMQHIEVEMRTADFSNFLGVLNKAKIYKIFQKEVKEFFNTRS